jgi:hypothetical protein
MFSNSCLEIILLSSLFKVTGHPFWRFSENRYCALNISPIFIKFSPNVSHAVHAKYDKVVKLPKNKIM